MNLTEAQTVAVVTTAAKSVVAALHPESRVPGFNPEAAWAAVPPFERHRHMNGVADIVLPVLSALPDVDGNPPSFDSPTIEKAVAAAYRVESAIAGRSLGRHAARQIVSGRVALCTVALRGLPAREMEMAS